MRFRPYSARRGTYAVHTPARQRPRLLLAVAAVATIVCRRFKQPLVLGYVVAGFLVSPAIGWIPNIVETADVSTWSQIASSSSCSAWDCSSAW